ncbi:MAG TPA: ABC transporter permease [Phycisphaerae bacterium]|nr:ABC transporter permease [Phycisphaerae bacterium]
MADSALGAWGIPLAIVSGAIRVSTPFLFVSLGECITERSGRINLGLEGTLFMGAMTGYGISYLAAPAFGNFVSPWFGVLAAAAVGMILGCVHALLCQRPRVNDIAVGIALMLFGIGLACFLGKPLIKPLAPHLQAIPLGFWAKNEAVRSALDVNVLFVLGCLLAPLLAWGFRNTRWGMIIRTAGESADAARAMGYSVNAVRMIATMAGGALAGVGGAYLSLYYPGAWNEQISSGQGLIAVALVIFARWNPIHCLYAALLFGGAGALAPAMQAYGVTRGYYLIAAAPYVLTLAIMVVTCSPKRTFAGAPAELGAVA